MDPSVALFGPVDQLLAPYIDFVLLGLLLVNMAGRALEFRQLKQQTEEGDWTDMTRHPLRFGSSLLLVLGSFYYLSLHHHAGMVFSILVLGIFITDLFEFESRQVEVRQGWELERPKGSIAASVLALLYILFQTLFFVVEPVWSAVV